MIHRLTLVVGALLSLGLLVGVAPVLSQPASPTSQPAEPAIDSPRLAALWQELKAGNTAALTSFWREIQGKAPLIEPVPEDAKQVRVTFILRGSAATRSAFLDGGLPGHPADKQLTLLPNTTLWFRTERFPSDARFTYGFGEYRGDATVPSYFPDRLNPRIGDYGSELELPDGLSPWSKRLPDVPQGKLTNERLKSEVLKGATRSFTVYTPAAYDPNSGPYGLLVLFDGEQYRSPTSIRGPIILDNLIAKEQIAPLIAVFVNTVTPTRGRDLGNSPDFADFLARELVPWVRGNYAVSADPRQVIIGGKSAGGLMASYCGLRHPEVFGNVLSQSGSYWVWEGHPQPSTPTLETETGWLTRQFATTPKLALRFYIEVGRLEKTYLPFVIDMPLENRRFRDVLEAKGYPVTYEEVNGAHDPLHWRNKLADGLMALARRQPSP